MAGDDDWRRKREREDDLAREKELEDHAIKDALQRKQGGIAPSRSKFDPNAASGNDPIQRLLDQISRAEPMIEQVNHLYNQFVAGVEKFPPLERRKQLDQLMTSLQTMHKPTAAYVFKFNNLSSKYVTHKERWDRLIKDLENGKIKRGAGPKA